MRMFSTYSGLTLAFALGWVSHSWAQEIEVRALARDPEASGPVILGAEAITPMFTSGAPAEVGLRLAASEFETCQRDLDEWIQANPDHPNIIYARFLLGYVAHLNNDHATAAAVLTSVAPMVSVLSDHAYYFGALSSFNLDQLEDTIRLTRRIPESSAYYPRGIFLQAQALRRSGMASEVIALLESFIQRYPNASYMAQVELELAEARLQTSDIEGAAELFYRVSSRYPGSTEEQRASERLQELLPRLPEEMRERFSHVSDENLLARATALFDRHRSEQVIELLEERLDDLEVGTTAGCQAAFLIGRSYSKLRRHAEAIPFYQAVVDSQCQDEDMVVKALYNAGRALWNVDREPEALAQFRRLHTEHSSHTYADDAMLYEARIERGNGNTSRFLSLLEEQVHRFPHGDMLADANWLLFEHDFSAGRYPAAIAFADAIALHTGEDSLYNRGRIAYFRARAMQLSGDRTQAIEGYRSVVNDAPLSYYALLALNRLKRLAPDRFDQILAEIHSEPDAAVTAAIPVEPADIALEPAFQRGLLLLRLGLLDLAQRQFDQLLEHYPNQDGLLWVIAFLFDRAGAYHISHDIPRRRIQTFLTAYPRGDTLEYWHLAYPLPFNQEIMEAAADRNLDPYLVYAIIREESGFNPRAESWANARGLMQLMLPTARSMAERLELSRPQERDLFRPSLSIALGSEYLRVLANRYERHPALTIAGYNGGQGNVDRWLADRGELDLDRFVEEIPYQQTRDYTKRVLMTYFIYKWLYDDDPVVEMSFGLPSSS